MAELTLTRFAFEGFAPQIEYSYQNNSSNIDLYERDSHRFFFGVTRRF